MKIQNILLYILFILVANKIKCQESKGGVPYTFRINTLAPDASDYRTIATQLNSFSLNTFVSSNLRTQADSITQACTNCDLALYGKEYKNQIDIISNATIEQVDSTKIWRFEISSQSAEAIQLYFSKFYIPVDGELYIYDDERKFVFGAFTIHNNPDSLSTGKIKFGCAPIPSDKVIIEYNQPINSTSVPIIELYNIIHVFNVNTLINKTNNTATSPCEVNVNCPDGYGWDNEKKSVVLILAYSNIIGYYGAATGVMINTMTNSGAPYLLTSGHVIRKSDNSFDPDYTPSSLMFLYNYETATCNTTQGTTPMNTIYSVYGSFNLSSKYDVSDFDYALLQLNTSKETLSKWGVCYAGWDKSSTLTPFQKPSTMIHHPNWNEKSISVSINSDLESVQYVSDPFTDPNKGFYRTKWQVGAFEKGSSGAPVFDYFHRIVGIFNGGQECVGGVYNNNNYARIAKFSKSWIDGNFGFWLDPTNSNFGFVNSYCPPSTDPLAANPNNACQTVNFTINGQNTDKVINVCTSDIWLAPNGVNPCGNSSEWLFKRFEQDRLCSNISDKWAATRCDQSMFNTWCHCYFLQLFFSVQECDYNLNAVGNEYAKWYYIYDGDQTVQQEPSNFKIFNFNGYFVPLGYTLQEGKYYKIKVATLDMASYPSQWHQHVGFIKTYANNLVINNQTITRNQIGGDITISNSNVPVSAGSINIVAANSIKILPETALRNGKYYIKSESCSSLNAYNMRNMQSQDTTKKSNNNGQSNYYIQYTSSANITSINDKAAIRVYPNPSDRLLNFEFYSDSKNYLTIELLDYSGRLTRKLFDKQIIESGPFEISLDVNDLPDGFYIIRAIVNSNTYINKFIKSHAN